MRVHAGASPETSPKRAGTADVVGAVGALTTSPGRLASKRVIVTGGANGIGRATTLRMVAEGASVAVLDYSLEDAEAVAAEAADLPGSVVPLRVDISDEESVNSSFETASNALGGLDIAVQAAGIAVGGATHEVALADWNVVIGVNLTGTFLVNRAALTQMLRSGGGSIVNVTSTSALIAAGPIAAYDASKAGVHALTRYIAEEYADRGIRTNAVAPGLTGDTNMGRSSQRVARPGDDAWSLSLPQRRIDRLMSIPMKRAATSREVAAVIVFLASDEASFVTGAQYVVDGGNTIS